jgi:hypothetical protein
MCQVFFVGDSLFAETLSQTLVSGEKVVIIGGESRACYEACVLLQAPYCAQLSRWSRANPIELDGGHYE